MEDKQQPTGINIKDKITSIDMEIRNKMSELQHHQSEIQRLTAEINKCYGKLEAYKELQV